MTVRKEDIRDLQPGDIVELHLRSGSTFRGPLVEEYGRLSIAQAGWAIRRRDGEPGQYTKNAATLTVVSRAPRPLYVNSDRTEPVPGDVVRDADDDDDARTWMHRGNTKAPEWIRTVRHYGEREPGKLIDAHDRREHLPARLRLLVDGETGMTVQP